MRAELQAEGVDPDEAAMVEDDGELEDEEAEIAETGTLGADGEMVRPWCAATRILDHRESVSGRGWCWAGYIRLGAGRP